MNGVQRSIAQAIVRSGGTNAQILARLRALQVGSRLTSRAALGLAGGIGVSMAAIHGKGEVGKLGSQVTTSFLGPAVLMGLGFWSLRMNWRLLASDTMRGAGMLRMASMIAAGAGVAAGTYVGRGVDRVVANDWYEENHAKAKQAMAEARDFITGLGFSDVPDIDDISIKVDRTVSNNAFFMEESWQGREIRMGRTASGDSYAAANDVVYHEYAHHLIDTLSPGLGHHGSAGALHEGIADSIAAAIDADDWTIGEDAGDAIRRLDNPEAANQPARRNQYINTTKDNGGVHLNATIVGHASYRMAQTIGRHAMAHLHLTTLQRGSFDGTTTFALYAAHNIKTAGEIYGVGSAEHVAVAEAWSGIGYDDAAVGVGATMYRERTNPNLTGNDRVDPSVLHDWIVDGAESQADRPSAWQAPGSSRDASTGPSLLNVLRNRAAAQDGQ